MTITMYLVLFISLNLFSQIFTKLVFTQVLPLKTTLNKTRAAWYVKRLTVHLRILTKTIYTTDQKHHSPSNQTPPALDPRSSHHLSTGVKLLIRRRRAIVRQARLITATATARLPPPTSACCLSFWILMLMLSGRIWVTMGVRALELGCAEVIWCDRFCFEDCCVLLEMYWLLLNNNWFFG